MTGTDILIRGFKAIADKLDILIKKIDTLDAQLYETNGKIDVLIGQLHDIQGTSFNSEMAVIEIKRSLCPRNEAKDGE